MPSPSQPVVAKPIQGLFGPSFATTGTLARGAQPQGPVLFSLGLLILATLLLAVGLLVRGPPWSPDVLMGIRQIFGSLLVFLAWAICTFCWGRWTCRLLKTDELGLSTWVPPMVMGPVFLSLLAFVLGELGLIGYSLSPLHTLLLFLGPFLEFRHAKFATVPRVEPLTPRREPWKWAELAILFLVALDLLERMFRASLAHGTTDPVMYHLLGPRLWSEQGAIVFWKPWPAIIHATYWEHLFIWGNSLLAAPMGLGLIEGQYFGQWTHLVFGYAATLAIAFHLMRRLGASRAWALVGCLGIAVSHSQSAYATLAKNDFGIEAWVLFAVAILLSPVAHKRRFVFLSGALLGMAFMGKMVYVISIAPWALLWSAWQLRSRASRATGVRDIAILVVGGFIGMLPILGRNYVVTGNPVFPMLNSLFPSDWLNETGRQTVAHFTGDSFKSLWEIREGLAEALVLDSPFNSVALLLIPLAVFRWVGWPAAFLCIGAMGGVISYCSWNFFNSFIRWVGPSLAILQFGGPLAMEAILRRFLSKWAHRGPLILSVVAIVPALYLYRQTNSLTEAYGTVFNGISPTIVLRTSIIHNGGDSRAWLRMNAQPEDIIVSLGDRGFYYNYFQKIFVYNQHPIIDQHLARSMRVRDFVRMLRSYNVKYILDVYHWNGHFYGELAMNVDRAAYAQPFALTHLGPDSLVIDLPLLEEELEDACLAPHPAPDDVLVP